LTLNKPIFLLKKHLLDHALHETITKLIQYIINTVSNFVLSIRQERHYSRV